MSQVFALLLCIVSQAQTSDPTQNVELTKLQGKWEMVSSEELERQIVYVPHHSLKVSGNEWIVILDDGTETKSTFKIDSSKTPKELDRERLGAAKVPGIYKLEGDTLILSSGLKRPTDFKIRTDASTMVVAYRRVKQ